MIATFFGLTALGSLAALGALATLGRLAFDDVDKAALVTAAAVTPAGVDKVATGTVDIIVAVVVVAAAAVADEVEDDVTALLAVGLLYCMDPNDFFESSCSRELDDDDDDDEMEEADIDCGAVQITLDTCLLNNFSNPTF